MIVVPVGNNHLANSRKVLVHSMCIMQQGSALSGIEQKRFPVGRFDQGGESMFTQRSGNGTNGIFTENGYADGHVNFSFNKKSRKVSRTIRLFGEKETVNYFTMVNSALLFFAQAASSLP